MASDAPHGPGGTCGGSQSPGQSTAVVQERGGAVVGRPGVAAPGQRLEQPFCRPSWRGRSGGTGVSMPPPGSSANENALKIGGMRAKWPLAS